jgi:hypothetical protein
MTLAEKNALMRFKTYLLIAEGDVEKALHLVEKFSPKDRDRIGWLREMTKAANERRHLHAAAS